MVKPNLVPNFKVDPIQEIRQALEGKDLQDYIPSFKKDGCRLELPEGKVLTRELNPVNNKHTVERFTPFSKFLLSHNVMVEGEFYDHDMSFEEIKRFFKTADVTDEKHRRKFDKAEKSGRLQEDWPNRSPEWLTTNHDSIKMWIFDCYYPSFPDMGYAERMQRLKSLLISPAAQQFWDVFKFEPSFVSTHELHTVDDLIELYKEALADGWEGIILSHKDRKYKMGRSTIKEGTFFKLKEDRISYIGEILDVEEATVAIPGAPKTITKLGRSATSKLQEHRMPSGMAKGFVTKYDGHEHTVSLKGFDHDARRELLENKDKYIGKSFKYMGMKPTKNCPRHAQFDSWL